MAVLECTREETRSEPSQRSIQSGNSLILMREATHVANIIANREKKTRTSSTLVDFGLNDSGVMRRPRQNVTIADDNDDVNNGSDSDHRPSHPQPSQLRQRSQFDPMRVDRSVMPGGPITASFEQYVRNIFHPNKARGVGIAGVPPGGGEISARHFSVEVGNVKQKINASTMLKMEQALGKDALNDELDDKLLDSSLESIYQELGVAGTYGLGSSSGYGGSRPPSQYPVYAPKSSGEYFSLMDSVQPIRSYGSSRFASEYSRLSSPPPQLSFKERSDEEWRKKNKQLIVDYKDFDSSPLSPYMYQRHPYVQKQDSRIVGSNFVQLTTRPRDAFLEKVDKTLAEIRSKPRI